MKLCKGIFSELAEILLRMQASSVCKIYGEKNIVRATRRLYGGCIRQREPVEILFTIGKPNFEEREFIRLCKKSGEPFPVKKIKISYPKTRRGK